MAPDLYYVPGSAPCTTVLLTARAMNLELNLKFLNVMEGEHLKPEFLKINPQHTIPTLVDGELAISESRAIVSYLVNQYGKGSSLYPEEPKTRALVDQRLYFDIGTLMSKFLYITGPKFYGHPPPTEQQLQQVQEALKVLNTFLQDSQYVAGSHLTIADLSILSTMDYFKTFTDGDIDKYQNIVRWYEHVKTVAPGYEEISKEAQESIKKFLALRKK